MNKRTENGKKVLVTAGNTWVPIDNVRGISNIFKGATGLSIARRLALRGCDVVLLTSHPDGISPQKGLEILSYRTYADLARNMQTLLSKPGFDIVIHSAAVSDYEVDGMFAQVGHPVELEGRSLREFAEIDRSGKVGSEHPELWMKLVPTVKLIDQIRQPWGFTGTLVKFKLQVNMEDAELIEVARRSMEHSRADMIVANTLEGLTTHAYIISDFGDPIHVTRDNLSVMLANILLS